MHCIILLQKDPHLHPLRLMSISTLAQIASAVVRADQMETTSRATAAHSLSSVPMVNKESYHVKVTCNGMIPARLADGVLQPVGQVTKISAV